MKNILINAKDFFFKKQKEKQEIQNNYETTILNDVLEIYTKIYNDKISKLNIEYFIEELNKNNYHVVFFPFKTDSNKFYDYYDIYCTLHGHNFKETKLYDVINNNKILNEFISKGYGVHVVLGTTCNQLTPIKYKTKTEQYEINIMIDYKNKENINKICYGFDTLSHHTGKIGYLETSETYQNIIKTI